MTWLIKNTTWCGQRLADEALRTGRYPLLVLPSTDTGFRLLAACEKWGMPVHAVGNPGLVESWGSDDVPRVMTPAALWNTIRREAKLPFAVATFEDQLVAIDDSYLRVELDDQTYLVSPIVMAILMKFRPPSYLGSVSSVRRDQPSRLALAPFAPDVPQTLSQQTLEAIMGHVLRPLLACAKDTNIPWHARPFFAIKRNNNFNRVLIQQVQEMESLVRLCRMRHPETVVPTVWLEVLRTSRHALTKQLL